MCSWAETWRGAGFALLLCAGLAQAQPYPGIARAATAAEVRGWDIDVRPDFKGLPKGSGSVAQGQLIWESKCSSCHGIFGESGSVFSPIVGGTTAQDMASGHVARLTDAAYPMRTSLMKLAQLSTLWDYIRRAMPWTEPKSLKPDEVYAVTAYVLNLGGIVGDDFVLTEHNIAEVQARLPNRNGLTTQHALWPGSEFGGTGKVDVPGSTCMQDCSPAMAVVSSIPAAAMNAHGDLAEQNRLVGAQRGLHTAAPSTAGASPPSAGQAAYALTRKHACSSCHDLQREVLGPPFRAVAQKYAGRADAADHLSRAIAGGSSGVWGTVAMPAQTVPEADRRAIAQWLAAGAAQ